MIIRVTQEDIGKDGLHPFTIKNPVQAAIDRVDGPFFVVWHEYSNMETGEFKPLPNAVKKFLKRWDHGREVEPFECELC